MKPRPGRPCVRLGLALVAAMSALSAPAQTAAPQRIEVQGQALGPVDERRLSLQMMTVIDRDELDAYGDTSVLDVLQRLPGVSLDGDQPRLRGLGGGYTQILLNGEPAPPGFSLEQLAPGDIERIEIIKGPSAEFGGVAGTINVILRAAPKTRQREWRSTVSYRSARPVGSTTISWGDRIGAVGLQLPLSAYQWAGANRSTTDRVNRASDGQVRAVQVNGQDQWHGGGFNTGPRLEWKLSERHALNWTSFLQGQAWGNGNQRQHQVLQGPALTIDDEATRAWGRWQLGRTQLQWTQRDADGTRLEAKAGVQGSEGRSRVTYDGRPGSSGPLHRETDADNRESRSWGGLKARWPLAEAHVLVAGWDLERRSRHELRRVWENGVELLTSSQGVPFDVTLQRQVLYAQDEWTVSPRLSAQLGLRAERLHTRSASADRDVQARSAVLTPIAQARWALDDKARTLLRGSLSRSSRAPDLNTLMGRYVLNTTYDRDTRNTPLAPDTAGNPQLQPERAWALELAMEAYLPQGGVVSVAVFQRRIDGLIRRRLSQEVVPEATVPRWVSRPVNLGRARSSGLEFELKGRADEWLPGLVPARSPWNLRASLSVYRSRVEQIDDPDARIEGQPPWQATLGFDRTAQGRPLGFGATLGFTPAFAVQQTDLQRVWRSAVPRLDAYAVWRFSRELQVRVSVQQAVPPDSETRSTVTDLDGFTASSVLHRPVQRQLNANLVWRF